MAALERMHFVRLLAVFFLASSGICLAEKDVDLTIVPPTGHKQGDNITVTCTVTEMGLVDFFRIVRKIDGQDFEITTNAFLKEVFVDTGRYRTDPYERSPDKVGIAKLHITNLQGSDGGEIGCVDPSTKFGAYESLDIKIPPKSVRLTYTDQEGHEHLVEEGGELRLKRDEETTVSCQVLVDGSIEEPQVDVYLGDKKVTDKFEKEFDYERDHDEGLLQLSSTTTMEYRTSDPVLSENGKTVKCTGTMPEFPPVSASATLRILYAPELECKSKLYSKVGTRNVRMVCKAPMSPPPSDFTWSWGKKPNRTTLGDGESVDGFAVSMQDLGNDMYEFILTIDEVTEESFHKYKIWVTNNVDESEMGITLKREEETTTPTSTLNPYITERVEMMLEGEGNEPGYDTSAGYDVRAIFLYTAAVLLAAIFLSRP